MVMEAKESYERWCAGLSKAASCCRELGVITTIKDWKFLSAELIKLRDNGMKFYKEAPLKESEVLILLMQIEDAQRAAAAMQGMQ